MRLKTVDEGAVNRKKKLLNPVWKCSTASVTSSKTWGAYHFIHGQTKPLYWDICEAKGGGGRINGDNTDSPRPLKLVYQKCNNDRIMKYRKVEDSHFLIYNKVFHRVHMHTSIQMCLYACTHSHIQTGNGKLQSQQFRLAHNVYQVCDFCAWYFNTRLEDSTSKDQDW